MIAHLHDTDAEIDHQYQRSIMQQQREIDALALTLAIRDNDYAEARREIAALRAQVARSARKPAPRYLVALAALACLWAACARAWRRWPYALACLTTALVTGLIIVTLRWMGGL